jgi:hypothetical protein
MAVVMLMEWDGVTLEQYEAVRKLVNWEGNPPEGGMFHVAAITDTGLRVTDLWESAEAFQSFVGQRLMPGVQQIGIQDQPRVEIYPVHALFTPAFKPA